MADDKQPLADQANSTSGYLKLHQLIGAAAWGIIGGLVGFFIGKAGDQGDRTGGQKFLRMVGGVSGALIGAYSSLKVDERERKARNSQDASEAAVTDTVSHKDPSAASTTVPDTRIDTAAIEREGIARTKESPQLSA